LGQPDAQDLALAVHRWDQGASGELSTLPGSAGAVTVKAKHDTLGTAATTIQVQQDAGATGQATPVQ
jgi:hypothetical protein